MTHTRTDADKLDEAILTLRSLATEALGVEAVADLLRHSDTQVGQVLMLTRGLHSARHSRS